MSSNALKALFYILPFVPQNPKPLIENTKGEPNVAGKTFDYVIVGGGLTGLTVANRLSENSRRTVLVIEDGYKCDDITTQVPGYANSLNIALMHDITSAPDANTGGTHPVWVGNVLGGGSVVNGMAFDRASAADYDAWERLGNTGWNWNSMLTYFKKSTTFTPPSAANINNFGVTYDASSWGKTGPVQASFPQFEYPDTKTIWTSFKGEGVPLPKEHGSGKAVGAFWIPTALQPKTETRSHARNAYYDPVKTRKNLFLITGSKAVEILFNKGVNPGTAATGVQYRTLLDGSLKSVYASREVIMAAGAVFTPQLLQLSGLGPKSVLTAAGIKIKKDIPAVGANLQDHPNVNMFFATNNYASPNMLSGSDPAANASAWNSYLTNRTGPLTQAHGSSLAFLSLRSITPKWNSIVNSIKTQKPQAYLPPNYSDAGLLRGFQKQRDIIIDLHSRVDAAVGEFPMIPLGLAIAALQRPLSRGSVTLNPKNKNGPPILQWNSFQNPADRTIMVEMIRWWRRHWARPELKKYSPFELTPGTRAQSDDQIMQAVVQAKALEASFAHMSGTCAMMPQSLGGCVSNDLLVYGVRNLSIVDASIIPLVPATHLQSTMYAVAEKAADIIKARG